MLGEELLLGCLIDYSTRQVTPRRRIEKKTASQSSAKCQGASETRNVSHPSAHGAPTDLRDRCSRGQVPAECLSRSVMMYKSKYIHGGTLPE